MAYQDPSGRVLVQIDNAFTYHAPKLGQPETYQRIRGVAKDLATVIVYNSPESREQSLALANLEQAVFWANAAVARHGL